MGYLPYGPRLPVQGLPNRLGFLLGCAGAHRSSLWGLARSDLPERSSSTHVHVIGNGCEAVFDLHCANGPPELRENYGFNIGALTRLKANLAVKLSALCRAWESIHGEP